MSKSKKKKEPFNPEQMTPEEQLKFEIAQELGLSDRVLAEGWKCLTSKESGRIGGLIAKKKRTMKQDDQKASTCQNAQNFL
ncbi:MAG: small, acid-soluble spore protein, alpha/beta type [Eubacteriales bacterium]|nr:small, acid-soluble spore protein, alpha/beta type [Eubacteriales bacterium]